MFCVMWSVGAFLELDDRAKMEEFIRNNDEFMLDLPVIPSDSDYTMFDFLVDSSGEWIPQFFSVITRLKQSL